MKCELLIFVLISTVALTCASITGIRDCLTESRNRAVNITIDISGCENGKCKLVKGNNHYVTTTFTPNANLQGCWLQLWGLMGSLRVPFGKRTNVCDEVIGRQSGTSCEQDHGLLAGREYSHAAMFTVRKIYPEISLLVRVMYTDDGSSNIVCYEVPVRIAPSPM